MITHKNAMLHDNPHHSQEDHSTRHKLQGCDKHAMFPVTCAYVTDNFSRRLNLACIFPLNDFSCAELFVLVHDFTTTILVRTSSLVSK